MCIKICTSGILTARFLTDIEIVRYLAFDVNMLKVETARKFPINLTYQK